jgi:mannose-6-phosphate isomerase-like protein (cupin superfamily)
MLGGMTYLGDGSISAALAPADGRPRLGVGPMTATVVADVDLTGGRYSLYHLDLGPGAGAAPHFHRTFTESFHVLSGAVQLHGGEGWIDAGPGDHLVVPEGGIHGFRNAGAEHASMLMMSLPGVRREDYFAEVVAVIREERHLTPEEWTALFARHDQYMV